MAEFLVLLGRLRRLEQRVRVLPVLAERQASLPSISLSWSPSRT